MRISLASAVGLAAVLGVAASLAVAPDVRAGGTVAGSPSLFACYSAQFTAFRPQTRTIEDAWSGVASLSVYAPAAICVPAPGASTSYLTCFRVKVRTSQLAARAVSVVDAFSRISQRLRVYRLETVCVPSSRVDIGGSRLPVGGLDRFACYTAKTSRPATYSNVMVADDFGQSEDSIVGPLRACAPAAFGASPVSNRTGFLTCYTDKSETKGTSVVVRNELGFFKAALGPREAVCTTATAR